MDAEHADYLAKCNCFVRYGETAWLPSVRTEDGVFITPSGLKVVEPIEWRAVTHSQIVAEMDERGEVPIHNFGLH